MTEKSKRLIQGTVVSDKGHKTIVVKLVRKVAHPVYGKFVKKLSKFHVHDEENKAKIGDTVAFSSCRPRSKTKHWELVSVIESA